MDRQRFILAANIHEIDSKMPNTLSTIFSSWFTPAKAETIMALAGSVLLFAVMIINPILLPVLILLLGILLLIGLLLLGR